MISNGIVFEAIVPIRCGGRKGTAFFIEPNRLLTARHVVLEAVRNNVPVEVVCKDAIRVCSHVEVLESEQEFSEVTLLTIDNYSHDTVIHLLSLPPKIEKRLWVAGFPLEIGNNSDLFDFEIHHTFAVTDNEYDVVASLKELVPFTSYRGFSGSPVVTDEGFAVGVITDKLSRVVGYSSVLHWSEQLAAKGLVITDDWEDYDDSPYGYGRSVALVKEAVKRAGDRYSPDVHVANEDLEDDLNVFCSKTEQKRIKSIYPSVEQWYLQLRSKYPFIKENYKQGEYASLAPCLRMFRENYNKRDRDDLVDYKKVDKADVDALKKQFEKLDEIFNSSKDILDFQCTFIHGIAGSGKTHTLCQFAESHAVKCQPYLLYGGQFVANENFLRQAEELLGFPDGIKGLDDYMAERGRYAVIIVDAINEGVGLAYWTDILVRLPQEVEKYKHLRFIFSARLPDNGDIKIGPHNQWALRYIDGFNNCDDAIDKYFDKYGVDKGFKNNSFYEFHNPLFLRIFCIAYSRIPYQNKQSITKLELFLTYLQVRNKDVANIIDEDYYFDVTSHYLKRLAELSLDSPNDGEITRTAAREISYGIYPNKPWSKSLLYACLQETLLLESYGRDRNTPCVEYEFENLGDFLKVAVFLEKGLKGSEVTQYLTNKKSMVSGYGVPKDRFVHFVGALLSVKDDCLEDFANNALSSREWDRVLSDTLQYNGPLRQRIIIKFIKDGSDKVLAALINDVDAFSFAEIETLHDELLQMSLSERDLKWSLQVNGLYDWYGRQKFVDLRLVQPSDNEEELEDDTKKAIVLLAWMLSSSYPDLRAILVRHITNLLSNHPQLALLAIDLFKKCNDPYVWQGLYCSLYGVVLNTRDESVVGPISESIYKTFYSDGSIVPNDWLVRYWTMKILERAAYLNPELDYWNKVRPPFETADNPFELLPQAGDAENEDFFGSSNGSHLLHNSLFGFSDFNRYVIGRNTLSTDRVLLDRNTHLAVDLEDVKKMIAVRIKELGWNEELGKTDNGKYSTSRFENEKERIGKKYQWLAYYDILGRLSDCCLLRKGWYGSRENEIHEVNYPWYLDVRNYYDPALQAVSQESVGIYFEETADAYSLENQPEGWYNDDTKLPDFQLQRTDNNGDSWIWMCGYDAEYQEFGEMRRSKAIHLNSAFVRKEDEAAFCKWAKDQNFYGRWMPERRDNIDFRWNEYPWADSYQQSLETDQWEETHNNECPAEVMVSYMNQLQEDVRGISKDEHFSSSVYMPCEDMMNRLGLYNAERGIIRTISNNTVVGFDYGMLGKEKSGMLFKESFLKEYLKETGYTLYLFVIGEKTLSFSLNAAMKDLSGCWKYDTVKGLTEVQPLHITASHPD